MRRAGQAVLLWALATTPGIGEPATTLIGGHLYAFPAAIFLGGEAETGPQGDILIELAWPEMRPLTAGEAAAWPRRATVRILLNSAAPLAGRAIPEQELTTRIPFFVSASIALSSGIADRVRGHVPPLRPYSGPQDRTEPVPAHGAEQVAMEAPVAGSATHDVFVKEPIDNPEEFIDCARHTATIIDPECAQTFIDRSLIIKASYRRTFVPQWREIQAAVAAFLRQHEVRR